MLNNSEDLAGAHKTRAGQLGASGTRPNSALIHPRARTAHLEAPTTLPSKAFFLLCLPVCILLRRELGLGPDDRHLHSSEDPQRQLWRVGTSSPDSVLKMPKGMFLLQLNGFIFVFVFAFFFLFLKMGNHRNAGEEKKNHSKRKKRIKHKEGSHLPEGCPKQCRQRRIGSRIGGASLRGTDCTSGSANAGDMGTREEDSEAKGLFSPRCRGGARGSADLPPPVVRAGPGRGAPRGDGTSGCCSGSDSALGAVMSAAAASPNLCTHLTSPGDR